MELNYLDVEEKITAAYRQVTQQYRRDDEVEVATPNHQRLRGLLGFICRSFHRPIRVLDVGCGTGRYFHCLANVELLVGIDVSEEMLAASRAPVLSHQVSVGRIELRRANAYLATFPAGSFDFIYSLGMFGHGCPVNAHICNSFHSWLAPGGKLMFNTIDHAGLPLCHRTRKRIRSLIYRALPKRFQQLLDEREQSPFFAMTRGELLRVLCASSFEDYEVMSCACESPLWDGHHLQCLATKAQGQD